MKRLVFVFFIISLISCGIKSDPESKEGKMNFFKGYHNE